MAERIKQTTMLALLGLTMTAGCGLIQRADPTLEVTTDAGAAAPDTGPLVIPDIQDAGPRVPAPNDPIPCDIDQCATGPKRCSDDGSAVLTPTQGTCVDGFCAFEYTREECQPPMACFTYNPSRPQCDVDFINR
jgi:hypothetical protein